MLLTQYYYVSPIIPLIIVGYFVANLIWELRTGTTFIGLYGGRKVYRKDNPRLFWAAVASKLPVVTLLLIVFFRSVLHLFR
jgi:hypothetical protein